MRVVSRVDFGSPRSAGISISTIAGIVAATELVQGRGVAALVAAALAAGGLALSISLLSPRRVTNASSSAVTDDPLRWGMIYAVLIVPPVFLLSLNRIAKDDVAGSAAVGIGVALIVFAGRYAFEKMR
jgi:hypothetical protein